MIRSRWASRRRLPHLLLSRLWGAVGANKLFHFLHLIWCKTHARWVEPTCSNTHLLANLKLALPGHWIIYKHKIEYDLIHYQSTSRTIDWQNSLRDMSKSAKAKLAPSSFAKKKQGTTTSSTTIHWACKARRNIKPTNLCRFHIAPSSRQDCMASHTCSNCTQYSGAQEHPSWLET